MTEPSPEALRELAPTGVLRAAINHGNPVLAHRGAAGEPAGISVELARALARSLDLPLSLISFEAAGKVFETAASDLWDVAFLAADPARAADILFTSPYLTIEATCIVTAASAYRSLADLDRPGMRIAVGKGAAYELHLKRTVTQATLVRAETSAQAIILFHQDGLDAAAGVRQPLQEYAAAHPELRVFEDPLTVIRQAIGTPKGRPEAQRYLETWLQAMTSNGFIGEVLERGGHR